MGPSRSTPASSASASANARPSPTRHPARWTSSISNSGDDRRSHVLSARAGHPPRGSEQRLGWQCLALEVDDIDDALRSLKLQGVEAAWGPVKRADYARAEIRDPDGNPIELRQWTRRKG
ncbi:VOC family protein [Ramlibacter montanisoli]|uniref:VOC family protein n=1 Tax=Ramlibacter montanisoli TaxID=2732512 RepID=UPI00359F4DE0